MATTLKEGCDLINTTLRALGYEYQIDTTSDDTMTNGLTAVGAFAPDQLNAIMKQMNLILQQRNYGVMFDSAKNKFRAFLVDMSDNGFGIEDVFHELLAGRQPLWDGNATSQEIANDLVAYDEGKVHKFFHVSPMSRQFKVTVDTRNYQKVFTPYGVTRYIDTKLANLSWSAEVWLMKQVIAMVQKMITDQKIVFNTGNNINTESGVNNMVEKIKSTVDGFLIPSTLYNYGHYDENTQAYVSVENMTDSIEDIFIISTPANIERLKVQGYSNAFNLSQFELEGRILLLPSGTSLGEYNGEEVLFVTLDRRSILIGLRRWFGGAFYVENTGWTNHWLTVEGMKGYNTVFNAVAFTGESVTDFFKSNGISIMWNSFDGNNGLTDEQFENITEPIFEVNNIKYYTKDFPLMGSNDVGSQRMNDKIIPYGMIHWLGLAQTAAAYALKINGINTGDIDRGEMRIVFDEELFSYIPENSIVTLTPVDYL